MNNRERRDIIERAKMSGYQGSYIDLFRQAELNPGGDPRDMLTAITAQEQEQGLRPMHEAGRTDASMTFPNVPPHAQFNTVGMKAPIDIKKYDKQGHLVKSYESVPPGIQNLDTGPNEGTVLETPSRMQEGGFKYIKNGYLQFTDNEGIRYEVPPNQFAGEVYDNGRPAVYYPENLSSEQDEKNHQSHLRYIEEVKKWEEGGRKGKKPFRFEYMLRPRVPQTPELDMSLKPMSDVKPKQGRQPELIMRSNPQMQTGQEPNYYKVWDDKRKQWSTRPVEPEELDRYQRENRRKQEGGPVKPQAGPRLPTQDTPVRSTESRNLDNDSTYNVKGWLAAGAPGGIDPGDGEFHGASVDPNTGMWLKSKNHPTAWKEHLGAQLSPDPFFKENMSVVNPEGHFGKNQLQYVPRNKHGGYRRAQKGKFTDEDSPKKNKPNKPDQGVINTQNTLRYRTKTNLPANGVWSDEWEKIYNDYLKSQNNTMFSETNTNILPNLIPGGLKTLFGDILYNQTGINIGRTWSPKEKDAINEIAKRNLEKGKYIIEYGDYNTGTRYGDVGGGEFVGTTIKKSYDPAYNMKTTLGQAQIGVAPEWGQREEDTLVFDQYDFNDGRDENILNPMAWGRVASDLYSGGVYSGFRSMGRQFGTPGGNGNQGRDVTIVTNRKKGGPRRRAQYGDFVTGRETYEPYQATGDNTGVSMPLPPVLRPEPLNLTEEEKYEQDLIQKRELRQQFGVYAEPQGIRPMAFGPVEAITLGGAALATGALSSTLGAAGSSASTAMNTSLLGASPGVSSVTAGNLITAGFGVHGAMQVAGMGEGPGLDEVLTGTGRARNYNTTDKAGYVGMRALELSPFGKNAMNLAEFGATQAGVGLGADLSLGRLGQQYSKLKVAATQTKFAQSDFYNKVHPSYLGRPSLRDRAKYYIPGLNPSSPMQRFGKRNEKYLSDVRDLNIFDVVASDRLFPTSRQLIYSDKARLYGDIVQETGTAQRAFKAYYTDPKNIDKFMFRYRDHVMNLNKFGSGYQDDLKNTLQNHSDPMKSLLGEIKYQFEGMKNPDLYELPLGKWLRQPASFNYVPQNTTIYPKPLNPKIKGTNEELVKRMMIDSEQIGMSPLAGDAGKIQRGLLDATRSRLGFQAQNAPPMHMLSAREAWYGLPTGVDGVSIFRGFSAHNLIPTKGTGFLKHVTVPFPNEFGKTDVLGRFNESRQVASVGAHENWHTLFGTRPYAGTIGINHIKPQLEKTVGSTLPMVYKSDDPSVYLRTLDEIGANIAQARIPSSMRSPGKKAYTEDAILRRNLTENPYLNQEAIIGNKLFGPAANYSPPWALGHKFRHEPIEVQFAEKQRRLDELMKIVPGIGGVGAGLLLQSKD